MALGAGCGCASPYEDMSDHDRGFGDEHRRQHEQFILYFKHTAKLSIYGPCNTKIDAVCFSE